MVVIYSGKCLELPTGYGYCCTGRKVVYQQRKAISGSMWMAAESLTLGDCRTKTIYKQLIFI